MSSPLLVGIDLGGTNCRGALVEADGRVVARRRMETRIEAGRAGFLARFLALVSDLLAESRRQGRAVAAIGIGAPGVVDGSGRIVVSPNLHPLDDCPLQQTVSRHCQLPVQVLNDANAAAWGEFCCGAGQSFSSFLMLTLGTGIGGGLILDGRLWQGADGAAGEVGHLVVEAKGRPCGCGQRGCLEQYAAAGGVVLNFTAALAAGAASSLSALAPERLTAERVAIAAREGDPAAGQALDEAGRRLGQVLGGIVNLLNPDGVVIGGGLAASLDLLLPALEQGLRARAFALAAERCRVVPGQLGDDAGIVGAALIAAGHKGACQ